MFRGVAGFLRRLFREFNRGLVQFTRWVGYLLFRGFLGMWGWARSRNWSYMLQALPAAAAAVGVIVLVGLRSALPAHELEGALPSRRRQGRRPAAEDWNRVILCQDRLVQMGDNEPKSLFQFALALDALRQSDRAMHVMKQIAPDTQHGYGEAHLWIAKRYFLSNDPGHRAIVEKQCKLALQQIGELSEHGNAARHLLGELYYRIGSEIERRRTAKGRGQGDGRTSSVVLREGRRAVQGHRRDLGPHASPLRPGSQGAQGPAVGGRSEAVDQVLRNARQEQRQGCARPPTRSWPTRSPFAATSARPSRS